MSGIVFDLTDWNALSQAMQLRTAMRVFTRNVYVLRNMDGNGWMAGSIGQNRAAVPGDTLDGALMALAREIRQ